MITRKPAGERGVTQRGWLDSRHSFSFGDYYNAKEMGFRSLRVINEDWFGAGRGFPTHPHRDMEIITIVLEGALEHKDSLGSGSVIRPGEIQKMTAGTGIAHSEANPDPANPVHLYQIWLLPDRAGLTPGYEQKTFPLDESRNRLQTVARNGGGDGAITLNQDAALYMASLDSGAAVTHNLAPGRHAWAQVLRGEVRLNGEPLAEGDGATVSEETALTLTGGEGGAEVLLFDLN